MTIIDFMRQKLTEYPKISEFLVGGDMHVGFTEPGFGYGLSSNGDSLIREDLLGNQIRQHNFAMYAVAPSFTDYCRIANSNFLLEMGYWLEHLPEKDGIHVEIDGQDLRGRFLKAIPSNAMAMQPMGETVNDGILYQIQIQVTYKIESEDL